jgi:hypothetical protein
MRLETLPLVLGVLIGLAGAGLILDGWVPDEAVRSERRRRPRRGRDRVGEALVGFGLLAIAAALMGRDTWRYTTVAALAGTVLLLWGAQRNSRYLRDVFVGPDRARPARGPGAPALPTVDRADHREEARITS